MKHCISEKDIGHYFQGHTLPKKLLSNCSHSQKVELNNTYNCPLDFDELVLRLCIVAVIERCYHNICVVTITFVEACDPVVIQVFAHTLLLQYMLR